MRGPDDDTEDKDPWCIWKREAGVLRLTSICAERRWYRSGLPLVMGRSSRTASGGGDDARRFRPIFCCM